MKGKDLLSIADLSRQDILSLISGAIDMKALGWLSLLTNKSLAILFEKPSLRTRVSFEVAMRQLGGEAIYISPAEVGLNTRESTPDVARVLCRYVNAVTARTFSHKTLETLAEYANVPVINALSDREHPCQALADLLTIYEKKGGLNGLTLAYIGDGNNVANSLLLAAALTGINFKIASPKGYQIRDEILSEGQSYAKESGGSVFLTEEPQVAVDDADIIYTDTWTSMGQESEEKERRRIFSRYQVNEDLVSLARKDVILMHCLPAHHGEEVAAEILDSPISVVFDQAENRMHIQKAILADILGGQGIPLAGS
ncbi:ornithine carbamoyltransferase [Chloroflexota bacterium]